MESNTATNHENQKKYYNIKKLKYYIFIEVWQKINNIYPLFKEKNINWLEIKEIYNKKLESITSFNELYNLLNEMISQLKDPHTKIFNYKKNNEYNISPLIMHYLNGKIYIIHVLNKNLEIREGSELTHINNICIEDFKKTIYFKYNFKSNNIKNAYLIREITSYLSNNEVKIDLKYSNTKYSCTSSPLNVKKLIENISLSNENYCHSKILNKDILYIQLLSFYDKTMISQFKKILLKYNNFNKIIIDVRNNNGGLIDVAKEITSFINDKKRLILYKKYRTASSNYVDFSKDIPFYVEGKNLIDYTKLAILCNENTSSSAECIFIKTLINSNNKIKVFGTKTAGLVHEASIYTLFDNVKLQITSNKYLDINKKLVFEEGIEPNYKIINTIEDILKTNDLVLNAGIKFCNL